ncbi:hypothetical protein HK101_005341 [Irineochytrium annulatum]|nr:hypothetical protein HK101_005341 [Irineochytrium annulatum]
MTTLILEPTPVEWRYGCIAGKQRPRFSEELPGWALATQDVSPRLHVERITVVNFEISKLYNPYRIGFILATLFPLVGFHCASVLLLLNNQYFPAIEAAIWTLFFLAIAFYIGVSMRSFYQVRKALQTYQAEWSNGPLNYNFGNLHDVFASRQGIILTLTPAPKFIV